MDDCDYDMCCTACKSGLGTSCKSLVIPPPFFFSKCQNFWPKSQLFDQPPLNKSAVLQLFRNYFKKWFKHDEDPVTEKIRKVIVITYQLISCVFQAEARLQETLRLAQKPSNFLVDQASVMSSMVNREGAIEVWVLERKGV